MIEMHEIRKYTIRQYMLYMYKRYENSYMYDKEI